MMTLPSFGRLGVSSHLCPASRPTGWLTELLPAYSPTQATLPDDWRPSVLNQSQPVCSLTGATQPLRTRVLLHATSRPITLTRGGLALTTARGCNARCHRAAMPGFAPTQAAIALAVWSVSR